jgi:hypothetical protein
VQGASALQAVLNTLAEPVTLVAVWEPVLPTDLMMPGDKQLALLSDSRVVQVWDPDHLVSDAMRMAMKQNPTQIPITRRRKGNSEGGVLWDAVAVFSGDSSWGDTPPPPEWLDGIVVDVRDELTQHLLAGAPDATSHRTDLK